MYLTDFPKVQTIYTCKLLEKMYFMNNYQIWRIGMSRKDLSHTLQFAKLGSICIMT